MVYVARGRTSGVYKIGCTCNLQQRAAQLADSFDETITMERAFPGSYPEETAIIHMLAPFRARDGECRRGFIGREVFSPRGGLVAAATAVLPPCNVVAHPPKRLPEAERRRRYQTWLRNQCAGRA